MNLLLKLEMGETKGMNFCLLKIIDRFKYYLGSDC